MGGDHRRDRGGAVAVIRIVIPGPPRGKGRARSTKSGRHYTPEETASYESLIKLAGARAMAGREPLSGAVQVEVRMHYPVPASASKKRRAAMLADQIRPTCKPDADNVLKAIFDGLNGVAFDDDKQISDLFVTRRFRETPGLHLEIRPAVRVSYEDLV